MRFVIDLEASHVLTRSVIICKQYIIFTIKFQTLRISKSRALGIWKSQIPDVWKTGYNQFPEQVWTRVITEESCNQIDVLDRVAKTTIAFNIIEV